MHPSLSNHQSWILVLLFVAVIHIHRGQCGDRFFKKALRKGRADFVKTNGRLLHTRHDFGLDDALHPKKFFKKLSRPTFFVENDKRGKFARDTSLEYCDEEVVGATSSTTEVSTTEEATTTEMPSTTETTSTTATTETPSSSSTVDPVVGESVCRVKSSTKSDTASTTTEMPQKSSTDSIVGESHTEDTTEDPDPDDELVASSGEVEAPPTGDDSVVGSAGTSSLGSSRLFKSLMQRPFVVSILRNFRVMLNVPVRFNRYQARYTPSPLDQLSDPTESTTEAEIVGEPQDEEEDCDFFT